MIDKTLVLDAWSKRQQTPIVLLGHRPDGLLVVGRDDVAGEHGLAARLFDLRPAGRRRKGRLHLDGRYAGRL